MTNGWIRRLFWRDPEEGRIGDVLVTFAAIAAAVTTAAIRESIIPGFVPLLAVSYLGGALSAMILTRPGGGR